MAKIPKELLVIESDGKLVMQINNYDGNILAFQIIIIGIPLFICTVFCALALSWMFFVSAPLLAASVYWMIYNVNDRTEFVLTKDSFQVFQGMHNNEKIDVPLKDIKKISIKRRELIAEAGGDLTIYELYLHTNFEELLITKNAGRKSVLFIKDLVENQMKE